MTSALNATAPTIAADAEACVACSHPMANHDTISLRYCAGTQLNALARSCICPQPK